MSPKLCCLDLPGSKNAEFSTGWACARPIEINSPVCEALLPDLLLLVKAGRGDLEGLIRGKAVGEGDFENDFLMERDPVLWLGPDSVSEGISRMSSGVRFTVGDPT